MPSALEKYQSMRDFRDTPEPSGRGRLKKVKPIFVVQKHQASHLHYDFRLEMEGVLKSWAVPKGPSYDPGTKRLAMMTEDHPYDYADFEGVIPEGNYGAGNVIIWDNGTWEFIEPGPDPVAALRKGKLTFVLRGRKLKGEWTLFRIHGRSPKGNEWLLMKHRDKYASETFEVTSEFPLSIVSRKDVDDLVGARQWQSNRTASDSGKPQTLAAALIKKRAAGSARSASKKKASTAGRVTKRKVSSSSGARKPARPSSKRPSTRRKGS